MPTFSYQVRQAFTYGWVKMVRVWRMNRRAIVRCLASGLTVCSLLVATGVASAGTSTDLVTAYAEDFEQLHYARVTFNCGNDACDQWSRSYDEVHAGTGSVYFPDVSRISDATLTPAIPVAIPADATAATLTFWHRYDFEVGGGNNYDGGLLEIMTNGAWYIVPGEAIAAGGYTGFMTFGLGNPLGGGPGWVGASDGWQQVVVDLLPYRGRDFLWRLRAGTDNSNIAPFGGWHVDDIEISYRAPLPTCSREWQAISPVPSQAPLSSLAAVGGQLYAFGGQVVGSAVAEAYRYSEVGDRWDPIAALPEPRAGAGAVSDGRYIYILGGLMSQGHPTGTMWRYDPQANNYVTLASFEPAVWLPGVALADGVIYRTAGRLDGGASSDVAQAYSIADDAWTPLPPYPSPLYAPAALALDGYLLSGGGQNGIIGGDVVRVAATYRYDPLGNRWDDAPIANLPAPGGFASGALYNGGWVVVAGSAPLRWDPAANSWRSLDQPPRLITEPNVAVAGNRLYVGGNTPGAGSGILRYREICGGTCRGDCAGDGSVSVADLIRGVNIALRVQTLDGCPSFDGNGDGDVTVNELIAAVGQALNGCGG